MDSKQREERIESFRAQLRARANPERARQAARFFPGNPPILGLPSGESRQAGRELTSWLKTEGQLDDVIAVADTLFADGVLEECACAIELLAAFWRQFGGRQEGYRRHWPLFDHWIGGFNTWASTDSLCLKVVGRLVLRDGPPMDWLALWAQSEYVWRRRAALVSLVPAVRRGHFWAELFRLADSLRADPDDRLQKALGWTLKELCKGDVEATIAYLRARGAEMSPLAVRYACEGMTPEQKARARRLRCARSENPA